MSNIESILDLAKGKDGQIVTIVVRDEENRLMMAKRRDNDRWTLPGGHMEEGEKPEEAAKRELYEEAGLRADKLKKLATKTIKTFTGKTMTIHAFQYNGKKLKPTSKNDPDKEVAKWEFIDVTHGLPESIADNLHSPKNVALKKIGLQKSDMEKSMRSHKYLRKYRRGDRWIYVYHEGENNGRAIPEEAFNAIKEAAEHGNQNARHLLESLQEHNSEKLDLLRQAAGMGHEPSKQHLKRLGIDHEAEAREDAQAAKPKPAAQEDSSPMSKRDQEKVKAALMAASAKAFGRLREHANSVPATKWTQAGITEESISQGVATAPNIEAALKKLHENLKAATDAHQGVSSSFDWANQNGGYANGIYNETVLGLERAGMLPEGYASEGKRQGNNHTITPIAGFAEGRAERERVRREAEEQARREAMERHGKNVGAIVAYYGNEISLSPRQMEILGQNIQEFFGDDFKFQDMINNLQGHPEVEIRPSTGFVTSLLSPGAREISVSFYFNERSTGRQITRASRTINKKPDGSISWNNGCFGRPDNDDLDRYPGMAKGLYAGVEKTLRDTTKNWTGAAKTNTKITIGTAANGGFSNTGYKGALVWAKHCFDFTSPSVAHDWRGSYASKISNYAARAGMKPEDKEWLINKVSECQLPEDFVRLGMKINRDQALKLTGRSGFDHDFDKLFREKGYVDIGEIILIDAGMSWSAQNKIWGTDERSVELNRRRAIQYRWTEERRPESNKQMGELTGPAPAPTPVESARQRLASQSTSTARTSSSNEHQNWADHYVRAWAPSGRNRNIAITEARLRKMRRWPQERVSAFLRSGSFSPQGRQRVLQMIREQSAAVPF